MHVTPTCFKVRIHSRKGAFHFKTRSYTAHLLAEKVPHLTQIQLNRKRPSLQLELICLAWLSRSKRLHKFDHCHSTYLVETLSNRLRNAFTEHKLAGCRVSSRGMLFRPDCGPHRTRIVAKLCHLDFEHAVIALQHALFNGLGHFIEVNFTDGFN